MNTVARTRVRAHVEGVVQGVGFRPFVHRVATRLGLRGWVRNDAEGVLIRAVGPAGDVTALERALRAIRSFPAPVIAMVHGSVWGGAFDLVASCDMIIADETCSFAITPANLGLPYNTTGLIHFLGRLPVNLVKEMFFTAAPIKGEDALRWGIVNHLVASAELVEFTMAFAKKITLKAPLAIAVAKEQLRVLADYQPIAAQVFERLQDMRRMVYESKDYIEGVQSFLEKRPAVFTGE